MEATAASSDMPLVRPDVDVSPSVLIGVGIYVTIIALAATAGNGSFIAVLWRNRAYHRDPHMILLMNMAICDLCISVTGYPFTVVACFVGEWIFGDIMCQIYAFACYTLSLITANTLVVLSVFRYIIICKPHLKYRLTPRLSRYCIAGTVIYALFFTATPLFGWSSYILEPAGFSCSFDWYDRSYGGVSYVYATCVFCYLVHLIIMGGCYYNIHKRVSQLKLDPVTEPSLPTTFDFTDGEETEGDACNRIFCGFDASMTFELSHASRNRKTYKVEIQVFKLNVLMVSAFFIIWSPYAFVSLASIYVPDLSPLWYIAPTVFAKTSCAINPILYGLSNSSLRREFRKLWADCCGRQKVEHDVSENHIHNLKPRDDRWALQAQLKDRDRDGHRSVYDDEGNYLGKVNQGTCPCAGCRQARKEVDILIRVQAKRIQECEVIPTMDVIDQQNMVTEEQSS